MGYRETTVPLSGIRLALVVLVLWALALLRVASAQYRTDLVTCLSGPQIPPACNNPFMFIAVHCSPANRVFVRFIGRLAWYPLQCVGPITVSVESTSPPETRFPIYVEVVPLEGTGDFHVCEDLSGYVVAIVNGHVDEPCGKWDAVGPIDITRVAPLGSLYAVRLYFFGREDGFSPAIDCFRITAHPVETTVTPTTWSLVKGLFK